MNTDIEIRATAGQMLRMDSAEATRKMKDLAIGEQLELLLALEPGPQRQELVLRSDRPELLTRSIPGEDFALTVKEIGDHDALVLIEMSSNEQLAYLLDLDMWAKTDLDMRQVRHWMEILLECGTKRFLRWTDNADFELLVLLFERWCVMVEKDSIPDLPDSVADRVISPDNFHYLLVKIGADLTLMRKITDLLFHEDKERFLAITANLGTTPPAELEELVLRWRTARMADRGWPDAEEAADFFQVLSPDRIPSKAPIPTPTYQPPKFPLQQAWNGPMFPKALELVDDKELLDSIALQVANLINRVIIAEGILTIGLKALDEAGKVVSGRIEVGLARLGASNAYDAMRIIARTPLIFLVQVANGAIMKRRRRALNLLGSSTGGLLDHLQPPLPEQLNLLSGTRPVVLDYSGMLPRPVQSMSDLVAWDISMDLAESALLLAQKLGIRAKDLEKPFSPGTYPPSFHDLTLQTILSTSFVRSFLGLEKKTAPVAMKDLQRLVQNLPFDKQAIVKELESWTISIGQTQRPGLARLLEQLSLDIGDWLVRLGKEDVDPRFMKGLWVKI